MHERLLRIVYKDFKPSFKELVTEDKSLNIHHRNLQKRLAEIFKVKNNLSSEFMNDVFKYIKKTILPVNKFAFQVKEDPYIKRWLRNIFLPCPEYHCQ